jgi:hypothetical protein
MADLSLLLSHFHIFTCESHAVVAPGCEALRRDVKAPSEAGLAELARVPRRFPHCLTAMKLETRTGRRLDLSVDVLRCMGGLCEGKSVAKGQVPGMDPKVAGKCV